MLTKNDRLTINEAKSYLEKYKETINKRLFRAKEKPLHGFEARGGNKKLDARAKTCTRPLCQIEIAEKVLRKQFEDASKQDALVTELLKEVKL